ncbi:mycofactocin biosynthesis chaperone MftB [Nesterenkonia pannonica]|uniref:mycofactocin biosynthesis chaperone MftB n=1 Tax=Nesterenkonia pannonica TaxID=1548602 RepID=UPI00216464E2|nr:mycofactocin biosynthesis chaperone MftB [Nesterenkonia pannonica]
MRPEPFGALLYHFGTRKLSFLKDRTLVQIVESLRDQPSARAAIVAMRRSGTVSGRLHQGRELFGGLEHGGRPRSLDEQTQRRGWR